MGYKVFMYPCCVKRATVFSNRTKSDDFGIIKAMMRLADLYGHSSPNITKIYLGIKQKELLETYSLLEFS